MDEDGDEFVSPALYQSNAKVCVCSIQLTQNPLHDQHLCPGELGGLHPEHLPRMVCDGLIGQIFDALEAVRCIDNQQTQEDGEGHSMSYKLHEGASQYLTQLNVEGQESRVKMQSKQDYSNRNKTFT